MGTRGYKAWRFRKRYYKEYIGHDSYPSGLGSWIAETIPRLHDKYMDWLQEQRRMVEEWEREWEYALAVEAGANVRSAWSIHEEKKPSWFPPMNDTMIEWVYILDLDREIFSINNSVHIKLEEVPHVKWVDALVDGRLGDRKRYFRWAVLVPGCVPETAITDLVVEASTRNCEDQKCAGVELGDEHAALRRRIVRRKKNLADIAWRRRHGLVFRQSIFALWSSTIAEPLAATLLQWTPDDLPFREIALAILCLASDETCNLISSSDVSCNGIWGLIRDSSGNEEFISVLTTGPHTQDTGSVFSASGNTFWLRSVLVVLCSRLSRPNAVEEGISQVLRHHQHTCPKNVMDAVLLSIEHVVLIHIKPDEKVQHTALLPLISIPTHLSMAPNEIFTQLYLEKLRQHKEASMKRKQEKRSHGSHENSLNSGDDSMLGYDSDDDLERELGEWNRKDRIALKPSPIGVEGDEASTFYALTHLFEAAARRAMPPSRAREGRFPAEIYGEILSHVLDRTTRHSCMHVSRGFRTVCQEELLITDGVFFRPWKVKETSETVPAWFEMYDIVSDKTCKVEIRDNKRIPGRILQPVDMKMWKVVVGEETGRRSLIGEFGVCVNDFEEECRVEEAWCRRLREAQNPSHLS